MTRFALTIEFDGGPYMGWQWQDHGPSVQGAIEEAIFKTTGEKTLVYSAGRTDAGVHAQQYFLHTDLPINWDPQQLIFKLNRMTPPDLAFFQAWEMQHDLHARFDATQRTYRYFLVVPLWCLQESTRCRARIRSSRV